MSFDIDIEFILPPRAIYTDELNDTCCYFKIVENIKIFCEKKKFNLIEKLCFDIYNVVRDSIIDSRCKVKNISVKLNKPSPPLPCVHGGVSFVYSSDETNKNNNQNNQP